MAPKAKATKPQAKAPSPKEYTTIALKLQAEYLESRPYETLKETKGLHRMTAGEQAIYSNYRFLETGAWKRWPLAQQKEFWKAVEQQKIPDPLPKPLPLGKDSSGRDIDTYTPEEYKVYEQTQKDIQRLRRESAWFRDRRDLLWGKDSEEDKIGDIEDERNRRKLLVKLQRKTMGRYESDPEWDDVVPIPQDDGEGALAQIAYTEEYSEAMGYLRAVMAAKEYSPRVLKLTEHIITLNPAHYTVWLYRASTIFALDLPIDEEFEWVNDIALENEKNYQIWHHRQLLVDHLYPTIATDSAALAALAESELRFINQMFIADSKNYHVWSYRAYLVRKIDLFNSETELKSIEAMIRTDVRNNSAWSHRFFLIFSNPSYSTPGSKATELDSAIPDAILDREIEYAKIGTFEAPQNQSPWNYLRGVLKKGGRSLSTLTCFAGEFVKIGDGKEEDVKSSHALDFLADAWAEQGNVEMADKALRLLGDKYDRVRKNYWEWRRGLLEATNVA